MQNNEKIDVNTIYLLTPEILEQGLRDHKRATITEDAPFGWSPILNDEKILTDRFDLSGNEIDKAIKEGRTPFIQERSYNQFKRNRGLDHGTEVAENKTSANPVYAERIVSDLSEFYRRHRRLPSVRWGKDPFELDSETEKELRLIGGYQEDEVSWFDISDINRRFKNLDFIYGWNNFDERMAEGKMAAKKKPLTSQVIERLAPRSLQEFLVNAKIIEVNEAGQASPGKLLTERPKDLRDIDEKNLDMDDEDDDMGLGLPYASTLTLQEQVALRMRAYAEHVLDMDGHAYSPEEVHNAYYRHFNTVNKGRAKPKAKPQASIPAQSFDVVQDPPSLQAE